MEEKGVSSIVVIVIVIVIVAVSVGSYFILRGEEPPPQPFYPAIAAHAELSGENEIIITIITGSIAAGEWQYSVSATSGTYAWTDGTEALDSSYVSLGAYAAGAYYVSCRHKATQHIYFADSPITISPPQPPSVFLEKIDTTPDYMQTDPAYGGLPDGGTQYCGPVSVSNSLMWLSDNGFPNLTPHSNDRKRDQFDVARLLGSPTYMNIGSQGVGANGLCNGLKQYILDKGYTYNRLEFQGWRYINPEFDTGEDVPNLEWVKLGVIGYGSVWLNIGWYTYDSVTDEYTRIGGHWITLVGYGHDGGSPNLDYLIAHDSASRAGTTFANEYILPVRINSGTLNGSYTGLPHSAVGFYKMTDGMHIRFTADFGILDAVIVLEMQP